MTPNRLLIRIVAAVIVNDRGEVLLVRKRGTAFFMQPGGKPLPGENDLGALARELDEELGCIPGDVEPLGSRRALAANEPGAVVEASLFRVALAAPPRAQAEIEALAWLHPDAAKKPQLAPLSEHHVLPMLRAGASPLRSAPRALFVCKGNWFRSQMAAAIYNQLAGVDRAASAGTYVGALEEPEGQILADLFPTEHFFECMERRGLYVRANATRRLTPAMLDDYEVVVSMAEDPFVPDFLKAHANVIWWEVENPKVVDEAKAEEIYERIYGLVQRLGPGGA